MEFPTSLDYALLNAMNRILFNLFRGSYENTKYFSENVLVATLPYAFTFTKPTFHLSDNLKHLVRSY